MPSRLPEKLNIVALSGIDQRQVERIRAVAPGRLTVTPLFPDFVPELREQWPPELVDRFVRSGQD